MTDQPKLKTPPPPNVAPNTAISDKGGDAQQTDTAKLKAPTLAENAADAMLHIAGGRSDVSLRESKHFDKERLAGLPLFAERGRLF